jgi:hypothetical protein
VSKCKLKILELRAFAYVKHEGRMLLSFRVILANEEPRFFGGISHLIMVESDKDYGPNSNDDDVIKTGKIDGDDQQDSPPQKLPRKTAETNTKVHSTKQVQVLLLQ